MTAHKTKPKTVRFNEKKLNTALAKSGLDTYQKLVDFLLDKYVGNIENKNELNTISDAFKKMFGK